jgi:hypothetical protein
VVSELVPEERTRDVDLLASNDGDLLTAQDLFSHTNNKQKNAKPEHTPTPDAKSHPRRYAIKANERKDGLSDWVLYG